MLHSLTKHPPASRSRYEDAVSKYEAVMKTEPNVPRLSLLAKERMCHALAKVRPLAATMPCNKSFTCNAPFFFNCSCLRVMNRACRAAEPCRCVEKSSGWIRRTSTC